MAKIDEYLREMVESGGSDLHLIVGLPPKIRVHGELHALNEPPIEKDDMEFLLKEICPPHRWETVGVTDAD